MILFYKFCLLWLVFIAQKAKNVVVLEVDKVFTSPGSGPEGVSNTNTEDPLYVGGVSGWNAVPLVRIGLLWLIILIIRLFINSAYHDSGGANLCGSHSVVPRLWFKYLVLEAQVQNSHRGSYHPGIQSSEWGTSEASRRAWPSQHWNFAPFIARMGI